MDVVVTVPQRLWQAWLAEGDLPGEPGSGQRYAFTIGRNPPVICPGERVYVVAHGKLRGYAPLIALVIGGFSDPADERNETYQLIRAGGAVAVTLRCGTLATTKYGFPITCGAHTRQDPPPLLGACLSLARIQGFRGWRYRWWSREDEVPFPDFQEVVGITAGPHQPQCREAV